MPTPKEVFDHPNSFWSFFKTPSDSNFEGQHFDRKEASQLDPSGRVTQSQLSKLRDQIIECISAFANSNQEGGLLILGISTTGEVKGLNHLNENQINSLTNINNLLVNQSAVAKLLDCQDDSGNDNRICLIYAPYSDKAICQTPGNSPKAYLRLGQQCIPVGDDLREQLKRDKRIVNFENTICCPYDPGDLDQGVVEEFRKVYLEGANFEYSTEELLRQAGAIVRADSGYAFTNAGFLFFSSNPQRVLPWAYIRLLRFGVSTAKGTERGLPTFERKFDGPLTKQIRNIRTFFRESGFFKVYQRRNSSSGFIEEPEFPHIAVDEAIVNAAAHRDYATMLPVKCESYQDAFIVINAGRIQQIDHDVPEQFSLDNIRLDSIPRNPKLIEWLKIMRNEQGAQFVRALSEGTESMRLEMEKLGLPAPTYKVTNAQTTVTLYNNAVARDKLIQASAEAPTTEFANLYPLYFTDPHGNPVGNEVYAHRLKDIASSLKDALLAKGWYVDRHKFSRIIAHRRGVSIPLSPQVDGIVRFFPAYAFQVRSYLGTIYLGIDFTLEIKTVQDLQSLLRYFKPTEFSDLNATVHWSGWQRAKIISCDHEWTRVYVFDFDQAIKVANDKVIPQLPRRLIQELMKERAITFDLEQARKAQSLSSSPSAARTRAEKTQTTAENVAEMVFPLKHEGIQITLDPSPAPLYRQTSRTNALLAHSLPEPRVEFGHHREEADIREGITRFGAYDEDPKTIELVPVCAPALREPMAVLIERLKTGKYKYRGSERTFYTRFNYSSILTVPALESILGECQRLLKEHPEWIGDSNLHRLFLIHTPEAGYALDDEQSPYYVIKRYLLENGIPCQMVDTPTIQNPDWKDLNLALNVVAKCGVTPWVLPDAIPDADFFVGLSYTESTRRRGERLMGYANVFNEYGRWEFYSGNTQTFTFEEKARYFEALVSETLERLPLSETPSIHFHHSAKFSRDDRAAILMAARAVRPQGIYTFVWINTDHSVRLYDSRAETNGSLSRGSYVITSPNQFYISTTGYNPYRKTLGTPHMLEINVWIERPEGAPPAPPDLKSIAAHILNLTKLNWASTDSLCAEPITTKYAHEIAYLTSAFLRQSPAFRLHPVLEKTPWFI